MAYQYLAVQSPHVSHEMTLTPYNTLRSKIQIVEQQISMQVALTPETARYLYNIVISYGAENQNIVDFADQMNQRVNTLKTQLTKFIQPSQTSPSNIPAKVNNRSGEIVQSETIYFDSLIRKQKYFVEMIDSLEPEGDISATEANLRYDQVTKLYEMAFSNQTEIVAKAKADILPQQIEIAKKIQRRVLSLQLMFKSVII